ncbi:hypothetical protein LS68_003575 [Helicobacter sp. MIT 05-5293]|uniref:Cytochrome c domain-containing protein n=1 Tax=uncultured Helicobacter sp. TaxID=175537 RepID=A0A650EL31_9HELI|nr:hypothetical protein [Helicobacter sp. MIT 05-5293]QGT50497.1 hypothetical protein Helico5904_1690 [uncultured Helicobacter sp.]TLD82088.1 hypothetical protein LS68_003575 [Helicobacter sp. MIT 05-5293]
MIKKIILVLCLTTATLYGKNSLITHLMQNMEYAMNLMERGYLYNNIQWINDGLKEFKTLNMELKKIDPHTYLSVSQRRDINVVSGIVSRNQDNIEVMEYFLKQKDFIKSADAYGRILAGCVSCHAISRNW